MENLSKTDAQAAINTFHESPEVTDEVRASVGSMMSRLIGRRPDRFDIAIDIQEPDNEPAIRSHFPAELQDNLTFRPLGGITPQD
ncbi:MAG TPA: hypothetical protein VK978_00480 [Candidatus Saccharimonadales bacterium]|nr:hypothetical protein [Candidatus Saccharimonadales bacterium]